MKDLKEQAKSLFLDSLQLVDIQALIKEKIQVVANTLIFDSEEISLESYDEILLIGFGKASLEMGEAIEAVLGNRLKRGILVTNRRDQKHLQSEVIVAGHPIPNANSLVAAEKIIAAIQGSSKRSLLIFLISGGGSSMVELPRGEISLDELQMVNKTLVESGATIEEINTVRKSLSRIKGGRLGQLAGTRKCLAIYLSDVNEGDLGSLASGPLIEPVNLPERLRLTIERYPLLETLPQSVTAIILGEQPQTLNNKRTDQNISHLLLLENSDLLQITARLASQRGFRVEVCQDIVEGSYQRVANTLIERLMALQNRILQDNICVLSGGEVECPVKARGIGGRNQEFVIYSATRISEVGKNFEIAILSGGTDGIDGVSIAAAAVLGSDDLTKCSGLGLDASSYINQNDSHSFLKQSGGLLVSGPTGNNVRDIRILLARPKPKKENL